MSVLISRSNLIMRLSDYALQESPNDNESTGEQRISKMIYDAIQNCISYVEEQPTAYSVDKVVAELEEWSFEAKILVPNNNELGEYEEEVERKIICTQNAIEIVKQGGAGTGTEAETIRDKAIKWNNHSTKKVPYEFIEFVEGKRTIDAEDDVCEWHCDEYGRWNTECNYLADNDQLKYTFCPYCGKKIKVVE